MWCLVQKPGGNAHGLLQEDTNISSKGGEGILKDIRPRSVVSMIIGQDAKKVNNSPSQYVHNISQNKTYLEKRTQRLPHKHPQLFRGFVPTNVFVGIGVCRRDPNNQ
jgi:hypothetical protein